jgi:hypothetical protein
MAYNYTYFKKSIQVELNTVDERSRIYITNYIDSLEELIKEKERRTLFDYCHIITINFTNIILGGAWGYALEHNEINIWTSIITTIYISMLFFRYKYTGGY